MFFKKRKQFFQKRQKLKNKKIYNIHFYKNV